MHRKETEILVFVLFMFEEFICFVQILVYGLVWCFSKRREKSEGVKEGGGWCLGGVQNGHGNENNIFEKVVA